MSITRSIHRSTIAALTCALVVAAAPAAVAQTTEIERSHLRGSNLGATSTQSTAPAPLPGPPTWPVNPQPIGPPPASHVADSGGGHDWTTIALGIAGGLLALGGIVAVVVHGRRVGRAHVSA